MALKRLISNAFKLSGYNLRSNACEYLVEVISDETQDPEESIERILANVQKQNLESTIVEKFHVEAAIKECRKTKPDVPEKILQIISAFEVPKLIYNKEREKLIAMRDMETATVLGGAAVKAAMYRNRYAILLQRILRHNIFAPTPAVTKVEGKTFHLSKVEFLLGTMVKLDHVVSFGMLTQLKEGKFYLEDLTGAVELNLDDAKFHTGLFTENCFVIAEGWFDDDILHVKALGFPPPETAKVTRSFFGNANFFGGSSLVTLKNSAQLLAMEQKLQDSMMVILSDVWLDNFQVMEKLQVLFQGYLENPPVCFVLMGNFLSTPTSARNLNLVQSHFRTLADLISEFPVLVEKSQFLFVPGPDDPGFTHIYPRAPLPSTICEYLQKKVPSTVLATSPCRIQYCTREIVLWRENIVTKICRNSLCFPAAGEVPDHFAKTIIAQAHLAPLPLHVCPVFWSHDHAMYLYPLPDLVVCADKFAAFNVSHLNCTVMNPGSFTAGDYSFKVYFPITGAIEDSQIPDDDDEADVNGEADADDAVE